ncbi:DUF3239 domain-containing protein [Corynebacterium uterequi]|uniref:DUF3239 domain-containing protein n=1 Tax=Corynebacterium uterequi TaxID=1072256 RepID=UPI000640C17B|nr:DUF3239 domain-containing protein [Corynebacterium uterequi]
MKILKFEVDEAYARKHNEMIRDTRRVRAGGIGLGVVVALAGIATYVWFTDRAPWALWVMVAGVGMGVVFVATGIAVARKFSSVQELYDRYPLVPAVVAEVNPRDCVLMALVNTNVDPELPPRWGLALRTISHLPGIKEPKLGMQVPCAAVLGRRTTRDADHWQEISPMPIAWATPDRDVIAAAKSGISRQRWVQLDKLRSRLDEVKATPMNLLVL